MNAVTKPSFHLRGTVKAPAEIRDLQGWLIWRIEVDPVTGQRRKMPYYANREKRAGRNGAPADRGKLVTFAAAVNAASRHGFDGVGLALMPEFNLTVLDFDHCVTGGELNADVAALVADTYAEFSPSGTGVHAIYRGGMPNKKSHATPDRWGFETFHSKGFVTFSGNVLDTCALLGTDDSIAPITDAVRAEYTRRFGQRERPEGAAASSERLGLTPEQAREWLAKIDPDIGYDAWLRVGMALHYEFGDEGFDLWDEWSSAGSKYPGSDGLATHWRSFGRSDGPPVTMASVAKLAGVSMSTAADPLEFPIIDVAALEAEDNAKPLKYQFRPMSDLLNSAPLQWIVKGVLPKAQLGVIYGASGSGKSFAALDMAMAIARGAQWRGHRVTQCPVAYVIAEGAKGFRKRVQAYSQANGVDAAEIPIAGLEAAPSLLDTGDTKELIRGLKALGEVGLVIIDTLAQVTPGADENTAKDMNPAIKRCQAISEATGALVLLVHHAGKDAAKGARGWSGIRAALDVELEVVKTEAGGRYLRLTKSKDDVDGLEWGFELRQITLGVDEDLDPITSCVVVEAEVNKAKAVTRKLGPREQAVVDAFQTIAASQVEGIEVEGVVEEALARVDLEGKKASQVRSNLRSTLRRLLENAEFGIGQAEDGTLFVR